jgi:hypothetical protein
MLYTRAMLWRVLFGALLFSSLASTAMAMSSSNYRIDWDSLNAGGNEAATSSSYSIHDTVGDIATGTSTSSFYKLSAGYRAGEGLDRISIAVAAQSATTTFDSTYSAVDDGMGTVVVSTPGAFSVGDVIAVVENRGFAQAVAIGKISSIVGSTLTVTNFETSGALGFVPSGGDDGVFRLSGTTLPFGVLSTTTEATLVLRIQVHSTAPLGYSVYMQGLTELETSAGATIEVVTDGAVTAGAEEYGSMGMGMRTVSPGTDLGVTTTPRLVQSSPTISEEITSDGDATGQIFKLSIDNNTTAGSYSQTVFYTLTPRF